MRSASRPISTIQKRTWSGSFLRWRCPCTERFFFNKTIDGFNPFLLLCRKNGDSTSVKIFEAIIDEEHVHFNYFDDVNIYDGRTKGADARLKPLADLSLDLATEP